MSPRKNNLLLAAIPSLTDVAFLLPAAFLFLKLSGGTRFLLGDGDTGWHIRAGEWMLDNGRVIREDVFSFTKHGEPWFAWEWLWDVVFASLHRHLGMGAVVIASMLILCVTSALVYRMARAMSGNAAIAFVATFLAVAGSSIHWLARPHLFSLLFAAVFYMLLERVRQGRTRLLWTLPAITVLWTNLHGGFFIGILLISAYGAGEIASRLFDADSEERRGALGRARNYFLAAAGCLAASLVNPYGWQLHAHIAGYLTESYHFDTISEFLPPDFRHIAAAWWRPMFLAGAVAAAWSVSRRRYAYAILILGWGHLALTSVRNVPIFLIVSAPVVALTATEFLALASRSRSADWVGRAARAIGAFTAQLGATDRLARIPAASGLLAAALIALLFVPAGGRIIPSEYDPEKYPARAIAALRQGSDRVFTDDEWGDYLIYRLYPRTRVFIDGRSDFYGADFCNRQLEALNGGRDWKRTLDRYGVNTVLLRAEAPLAATLKESKRWRVDYEDKIAILFRAESAELAGPGLEGKGVPAIADGGLQAIARSPISTTVIIGSHSYARR